MDKSITNTARGVEIDQVDYRGMGIIIPEILFSAAAFCNLKPISIGAGTWHFMNSLNRDLWIYFGSSLDYADRFLRNFGRRKALGNLFLAVVLEIAICCCVEAYLKRVKPKLEERNSPAYSLCYGVTAIRLIVYVGVTLFKRDSYLASRCSMNCDLSSIWSDIAIHSKVWGAFWLLLGLATLLMLYALSLCRDNILATIAVLFALGMMGFMLYAVGGVEAIQSLVYDTISSIENIASNI